MNITLSEIDIEPNKFNLSIDGNKVILDLDDLSELAKVINYCLVKSKAKSRLSKKREVSVQGRLLSIIISDYRKRNNLSQSRMAKIVGCTHLALVNWEKGYSLPSGRFAKVLSEMIPEFEISDFKRAK